ncbi:uncharacterized WD repeat-containing protein all2124-like [Gigantopelta aegis]|uniref:uncharacterized WD repeat-containing protein all2124-like n=1 Tax=Gigantopelta aegis TaxID=1735272 RepID=UPI001B88B557|nr:uncharacterized WD repeat-containing protein all2124-like [Gigantopelta aegis]
MAMEKQFVIRETHGRTITSLGYNPIRRELFIGCEDGVMKIYEAETGKLLQSATEHTGWVTDFIFWMNAKVMLSASNDGFIMAWGSGGLQDKIKMGIPIYCMAINPRRTQLVCGVNGGIRVYNMDERRECGHFIDHHMLYVATEHTDLVRNIVCYESRTYSAGYDRKLVIYDSSYTGDNGLEPIFINPQAHEAGISCLVLGRDAENSMWILTGSFDKTVKIWSIDGKLVHRLDNFISSVSGVCYVPLNTTIWVAGGLTNAVLYDPKSGENVSDFIGTFQQQEDEKYELQLLKFFPELNQVVASTSRRHLIVWKYNSSGCITAVKYKTPLDCLCYTTKFPILMFSGDSDGVIVKWERMQSNNFMYSKESFLLTDTKLKKQKRTGSRVRQIMMQQEVRSETNKNLTSRSTANWQKMARRAASQYAFNKALIPPVITKHPSTTILRIVFVESLDFILAASEDSNIYVWGFDTSAVAVLKNMKPLDLETLVDKYSVLLDTKSELRETLPERVPQENDSVTNRVAGFICRYVFSEHLSSVTSLVVIGREYGFDRTYVLSAGWDSRICIWDLENGELHDTFRSPIVDRFNEKLDIACDGVILDMDYSPDNNEFAYASSDKMVYIRTFSPDGLKMVLVSTLLGHEGDVTCVHWNKITKKWVTGSEDGTVRIWSGTGLTECEQVLAVRGDVRCMCIDKVNGAIIAGVEETIKVYEPESYRLVQTNVGHSDSVRSIIHIPERSQYVTCSWDKTFRVWNAWKQVRRFKQKESPKTGNKVKVPHDSKVVWGNLDANDEKKDPEKGEHCQTETGDKSNNSVSQETEAESPDIYEIKQEN